jgi:DHA3 family macrolide efflux protein-like MFS transporter
MGIGRNLYIWSLAAIFASLPIPFIGAAQNVILYRHIPSGLQGRIFAVRNALQYSTIPIGILLGGFLADYVFEPFMASHAPLAKALGRLTGNTPGSGMAVMFLCTGILGFFFSILWLRNREIKKISQTAE